MQYQVQFFVQPETNSCFLLSVCTWRRYGWPCELPRATSLRQVILRSLKVLMCTLSPTPRKPKPVFFRVVDPDRVRSASFCRTRIGIGIQGMPIRIRPNRIDLAKVSRLLVPGFLKSKGWYGFFPMDFGFLVVLNSKLLLMLKFYKRCFIRDHLQKHYCIILYDGFLCARKWKRCR